MKKNLLLLLMFIPMLNFGQSNSDSYCIPKTLNSAYYIDGFSTTGGITNISNLSSGFSSDGYGDFTSMTVKQLQGGEINFTATFTPDYAFGFRIWVDWNQDGTFDENEVAWYSSDGYALTHSGSFNVPQDALLGETRMRIAAHYLNHLGDIDPCITGFLYGEFEDYTFEVETYTGYNTTNELGNLSVYPVPARNTVTFEYKGVYELKSIVVVNSIGQVVYNGQTGNGSNFKLNVTNYATGIYHATIILSNSNVIQRKFNVIQ